MDRWLGRLAWTGAALALFVAVLGAYVRLNHAGMGCPDWPVCYGKITWPVNADEVALANEAFPERPVETGKAWREQVHRFAAAILGLVVMGLALALNRAHRARSTAVGIGVAAAIGGTLAYIFGSVGLSVALSVVAIGAPLSAALFIRRTGSDPGRVDARGRLAAGLLALVIFQAMLGMWTVTLLLKPAIVTAHLLGGFATLSLLAWLGAMHGVGRAQVDTLTRRLAVVALVAVLGQVFLGGWTSTNYAALACPDFPTCQGRWWPETDLGEAFVLWRGVGVDYEGGVLDGAARTGIHAVHRVGAVVVTLVLLLLVARLFQNAALRSHAAAIGALLFTQLGLGIWNVVGGLPLWVATAHNGAAALLLVSVVLLLHRAEVESTESAPLSSQPLGARS